MTPKPSPKRSIAASSVSALISWITKSIMSSLCPYFFAERAPHSPRGGKLVSSFSARFRCSVLSTTRFPEAVSRMLKSVQTKSNAELAECSSRRKTSPNSSPNCAPKVLQLVLSAPLNSIDTIDSPRLTTALLTEGL